MKILIIEDEPRAASFIKQGLEEPGYETEVVFGGQMGKKFAIANHYDLLLLDIVIPYMSIHISFRGQTISMRKNPLFPLV